MPIQGERGRWAVILDDGGEIQEPHEGGFGALPLDRVCWLVFTDQDGTVHRVLIDGDKHPIFTRRVLTSYNPNTAEHTLDGVIVGMGWKHRVNGVEAKSILWLFPDGSSVQSDRHIRDLMAEGIVER